MIFFFFTYVFYLGRFLLGVVALALVATAALVRRGVRVLTLCDRAAAMATKTTKHKQGTAQQKRYLINSRAKKTPGQQAIPAKKQKIKRTSGPAAYRLHNGDPRFFWFSIGHTRSHRLTNHFTMSNLSIHIHTIYVFNLLY